MTASTCSRVVSLTLGSPLTTRETVERDTPARLAICSRVRGMVWERSQNGTVKRSPRSWRALCAPPVIDQPLLGALPNIIYNRLLKSIPLVKIFYEKRAWSARLCFNRAVIQGKRYINGFTQDVRGRAFNRPAQTVREPLDRIGVGRAHDQRAVAAAQRARVAHPRLERRAGQLFGQLVQRLLPEVRRIISAHLEPGGANPARLLCALRRDSP